MSRNKALSFPARVAFGLAIVILGSAGEPSIPHDGAGYAEPRLQTRPGPASITEPYPYLHGGSFSDPHVSESPDPLVSYRWDETAASDGLQIYILEPASVHTDSPGSFRNADSLTGENPWVEVLGTGSIRLDFGVVSAAWLEMESPDLSGEVEMSISEYNEPAVVNFGPRNPMKTRKPEKHGDVYRLELNDQLYEGVRFGWIHVRTFNGPWHISGVRLVCQIKPANYTGRFSSNDSKLTRIWYTGAYVVKINLLKDHFGAILMDRGDRHSWTGDAYPAQAAALAAFANYDFVKMNLERTADDNNGIESYSLYWILSVVDYYRYTGDHATLDRFISNIQSKLGHAQAVYDNPPNLLFFGWDERLGAGFENPNIEEARRAYRMVFIRACREFAWAMDHFGRPDLARHYEETAQARMDELRSRPQWAGDFGLHAGADAVNTGLLSGEEQRDIFEKEFTGPVQHMSYSPFNQYFVIQALARMNKHEEALDLVRAYWGGQIDYGGTTFFEVYRPDWNPVLGKNDPVPNNQCGYTSLAHPWGAGVTKWLTEEILGIKPVEPGFSRYSILPRPGPGATAVEGSALTPHGEIRVSYNLSTGRGRITAPPGTTGRIGIPKAGRRITSILAGGEIVWNGRFHPTANIGAGDEDEGYVYFDSVKPGQYEFSVAYAGSPAPADDSVSMSAKLIGVDSTTQGNWGGVYGKDGYILCNYSGIGEDVRTLPSYVSFVTGAKTQHVQWTESSHDPRAPAPDPSNGFPRKVGCYHTGDPVATYQTMTVDIGLVRDTDYQVALYFVDWDGAGRRSAVEVFDYETKKLISPVAIVSHFEEGAYLVYSYNKSLRFRINHVRGPNAVLSGIFFDGRPGASMINLNRSALHFGAVAGSVSSRPQALMILYAGDGAFDWTATPSVAWLKAVPQSGRGNAVVTISADATGWEAGSYTGDILFEDPEAANSPQKTSVFLEVFSPGSTHPPFGSFDTPGQGIQGVQGAIPLSGWALDDIEVSRVEILRDRHPSDSPEVVGLDGLVHIGDAVFVEGARPDVEAHFPRYPFRYRAGWGYMLLTNTLPDSGNGSYTFHAMAYDREEHRTVLGRKTIHCDNAHAVKPFGAIDTPPQGGTASGRSYLNFGWVLTPQPKMIPQDGSTIMVWINGLPLGNPVYGNYREDIAHLFPGLANSSGSVGYFSMDTTSWDDGVHTIAWGVRDSDGSEEGIGSHYFTIINSGDSLGEMDETRRMSTKPIQDRVLYRRRAEAARIPVDFFSPVNLRKGFRMETLPEALFPDSEGMIRTDIFETERVEIHLGGRDPSAPVWSGHLAVGDELRVLPIGSTLDSHRGLFTWQPGPGFLGAYEFLFIRHDDGHLSKRIIKINILPRFK